MKEYICVGARGQKQVRAWEIVCIWERELLEEWEQRIKRIYYCYYRQHQSLVSVLIYMSCRLNLQYMCWIDCTLQSQAEDLKSTFVVILKYLNCTCLYWSEWQEMQWVDRLNLLGVMGLGVCTAEQNEQNSKLWTCELSHVMSGWKSRKHLVAVQCVAVLSPGYILSH